MIIYLYRKATGEAQVPGKPKRRRNRNKNKNKGENLESNPEEHVCDGEDKKVSNKPKQGKKKSLKDKKSAADTTENVAPHQPRSSLNVTPYQSRSSLNSQKHFDDGKSKAAFSVQKSATEEHLLADKGSHKRRYDGIKIEETSADDAAQELNLKNRKTLKAHRRRSSGNADAPQKNEGSENVNNNAGSTGHDDHSSHTGGMEGKTVKHHYRQGSPQFPGLGLENTSAVQKFWDLPLKKAGKKKKKKHEEDDQLRLIFYPISF